MKACSASARPSSVRLRRAASKETISAMREGCPHGPVNVDGCRYAGTIGRNGSCDTVPEVSWSS